MTSPHRPTKRPADPQWTADQQPDSSRRRVMASDNTELSHPPINSTLPHFLPPTETSDGSKSETGQNNNNPNRPQLSSIPISSDGFPINPIEQPDLTIFSLQTPYNNPLYCMLCCRQLGPPQSSIWVPVGMKLYREKSDFRLLQLCLDLNISLDHNGYCPALLEACNKLDYFFIDYLLSHNVSLKPKYPSYNWVTYNKNLDGLNSLLCQMENHESFADQIYSQTVIKLFNLMLNQNLIRSDHYSDLTSALLNNIRQSEPEPELEPCILTGWQDQLWTHFLTRGLNRRLSLTPESNQSLTPESNQELNRHLIQPLSSSELNRVDSELFPRVTNWNHQAGKMILQGWIFGIGPEKYLDLDHDQRNSPEYTRWAMLMEYLLDRFLHLIREAYKRYMNSQASTNGQYTNQLPIDQYGLVEFFSDSMLKSVLEWGEVPFFCIWSKWQGVQDTEEPRGTQGTQGTRKVRKVRRTPEAFSPPLRKHTLNQLLFTAAKNRSCYALKFCVEQGADFQKLNPYRKDILSVYGSNSKPITKYEIETFQWLIKQGVDINRQLTGKCRPLHNVVKQPQLLKVLIENGAPLQPTNRQGVTPIISAVHVASWKSVQILLRAGDTSYRSDRNVNRLARKKHFQREYKRFVQHSIQSLVFWLHHVRIKGIGVGHLPWLVVSIICRLLLAPYDNPILQAMQKSDPDFYTIHKLCRWSDVSS